MRYFPKAGDSVRLTCPHSQHESVGKVASIYEDQYNHAAGDFRTTYSFVFNDEPPFRLTCDELDAWNVRKA